MVSILAYVMILLVSSTLISLCFFQFTKIGQYVSDKEYLTKLATHLVFGLEHIKNDITDGTNAYNNGEFSKAGKSFGDAVHFTFFWDFK
jgi:hypothetical protein